MATFAELDENNIVLNVIRVADEHCWDEDKNELESVGIAYLKVSMETTLNGLKIVPILILRRAITSVQDI